MHTKVDRRAIPVAIVAADALLAALIGAAVELAGFRPAFSRAGETPTETVRRVRPMSVLIDAHDETLLAEPTLGRTLMTGARLVLFGSRVQCAAMTLVARRYGADLWILPDELERLPAILHKHRSASSRRVEQ